MGKVGPGPNVTVIIASTSAHSAQSASPTAPTTLSCSTPTQPKSHPQTTQQYDTDRLFQDSTCQCQSPYAHHLSMPPAFPICQVSAHIAWYFSTGYPLPQTSISSGECQALQGLTWAATTAELSSTLVDKTTGRVSYLFWEGNIFIAVFITLTLTDAVFPPLSSLSSGFPETQVTTFPHVKGVMQSAINILRLQLD